MIITTHGLDWSLEKLLSGSVARAHQQHDTSKDEGSLHIGATDCTSAGAARSACHGARSLAHPLAR